MFEFSQDDEARIVRVVVGDFWTVEEARDFANHYRENVRIARAQWGVVRMLVDARASPVQATEVAQEYVGLHRTAMTDPRDRVAVIVATSLVKMQTRRVLTEEMSEATDAGNVFVSPEAAETWLCADKA